jgi:hypothetical protein
VILKGVSNAETTTTTLINGGLGAALSLRVRPGSPPLTVNAAAGTATNLSADKLDGKDSTAFLGATAKAADADKLDGRDSTDFLGANDKAADADKLDGKDSTDFAPAGTAAAYTARNDAGKSMNPESWNVVIVSKDVPAGSYAINAKVSLHNIDDDDWTNASCQLRAGGSVVERGSLLTMGINGGQEADAVASTEEYPLQAVVAGFGGGAITIICNTFSNSDRVDATNAVVTAIKVGSVE